MGRGEGNEIVRWRRKGRRRGSGEMRDGRRRRLVDEVMREEKRNEGR